MGDRIGMGDHIDLAAPIGMGNRGQGMVQCISLGLGFDKS